MKDFINQTIVPGSYLAKGGSGNSSCEYGMILYSVLAVSKDSLSCLRLRIARRPLRITVNKSTLKNPNGVVVINPSEEIISLFNAAKANTLTEKEKDTIDMWMHGASHVRPWKQYLDGQ